MDELEQMTKERDELAQKVADLEAELAKLRDEQAADDSAAAAAEENKGEVAAALARVAKLEAALATSERDRYIEARLMAGELVPAKRAAVEKLYALGGVALVEEHYPKGQRVLPTPVGHGQPTAIGDATTPAARFNAAVEKVKAERKCSHDEASRYVQTAPEHAEVVAALAASMRRR